jgi:hypothetical protein
VDLIPVRLVAVHDQPASPELFDLRIAGHANPPDIKRVLGLIAAMMIGLDLTAPIFRRPGSTTATLAAIRPSNPTDKHRLHHRAPSLVLQFLIWSRVTRTRISSTYM